jgi:hypothetical protein
VPIILNVGVSAMGYSYDHDPLVSNEINLRVEINLVLAK